MGMTKNEIFIKEKYSRVFDITNSIQLWTKLFSEYEKAEIITQSNNYIKFKLTQYPDEYGKVYSWVSERFLDKENYIIHARRIAPLYPFKYMSIIWEYVPLENGTQMKWIQQFEMDDNCPISDKAMENNLNNGSKTEMRLIKNFIEKQVGDISE